MVRTGDHNHPDRAGVVVSRGNDLTQLCAADMDTVALDLGGSDLSYIGKHVAFFARSSASFRGQHGMIQALL